MSAFVGGAWAIGNSAGGVAAWATTTQRDTAGYLTTKPLSIDTSSYAITGDNIHLGGADLAGGNAAPIAAPDAIREGDSS